jgi:hypothetical protein
MEIGFELFSLKDQKIRCTLILRSSRSFALSLLVLRYLLLVSLEGEAADVEATGFFPSLNISGKESSLTLA